MQQDELDKLIASTPATDELDSLIASTPASRQEQDFYDTTKQPDLLWDKPDQQPGNPALAGIPQGVVAGAVRGLGHAVEGAYDLGASVYERIHWDLTHTGEFSDITRAGMKRLQAEHPDVAKMVIPSAIRSAADAIAPNEQEIAKQGGASGFAYKAFEGLGEAAPAMAAGALGPAGVPTVFGLQSRGAAREQAIASGASPEDQDAYVNAQTALGAALGAEGPAGALTKERTLLQGIGHGAVAGTGMGIGSELARMGTIEPNHKFDWGAVGESAGLMTVQNAMLGAFIGRIASKAEDPGYAEALKKASEEAGIPVQPSGQPVEQAAPTDEVAKQPVPEVTPSTPEEKPTAPLESQSEPLPGQAERAVGAGQQSEPGPEAWTSVGPEEFKPGPQTTEPDAPEEPWKPEPPPEGTPQPEEDVTGIRRSIVDKTLADLGIEAPQGGEKRPWEPMVEQALAQPKRGQTLLEEFARDPTRLASDQDFIQLGLEFRSLKNEYAAALRERDPVRAEIAKDKMKQAADIIAPVKTRSGQSLSAIAAVFKPDNSLGTWVMERETAKGGDLSDEEMASLTALHDRLDKAEAALAELSKQNQASDQGVDQFLKEGKRKSKPRGEIRQKLYAAKEESLKWWKENMATASANPFANPEAIYHAARIGASHLADFAADFAGWSKKMVEDLGEAVKPHLQALYEKSKEIHAAAGIAAIKDKIKGRIADNDPNVGRYIQKLAEHFTPQAGTATELVSLVHDAVADLGFSRQEVRDAISGYGKFRELPKSEIKAKLRDFKGQLQQIGKLRDMLAEGQAPKKTGQERRTPSDKERQLAKSVTQFKKELGIETTDPATQLKSALETRKTGMRNQISDLQRQIDAREMDVKSDKPQPSDAEFEAMKKQRDALKAQFDEIFGKGGMTDEQRMSLSLKHAEESLKEYDQRVKQGDISEKAEKQGPPTAETARLQEQRDAVRARRDALKAELQVMKDAASGKASPEEAAINRRVAQIQAQTAHLHEKSLYGDYSTKTRPIPISDPRIAEAAREKQGALKTYERGKLASERANETKWDRRARKTKTYLRQGAIGGIGTLEHIGAAHVLNMVFRPLYEMTGGIVSKVLPGLAERAPIQGGFALDAVARGTVEGTKALFREFGTIVKTSESELDKEFSQRTHLPPEAMEMIGTVHAAIQNLTVRSEWEMAMHKQAVSALKQNIPTDSPEWRFAAGTRAYLHAQEAAFRDENNWFAKRVQRFIADHQKAGPAEKAFSVLGTAEMPVVLMPANWFAVGAEHIYGAGVGTARAIAAYAKGIENLTPDQGDVIMRNLKRGLLGNTMIALGAAGVINAAGFWQHDKKLMGDNKDAGSIGGVPSNLLRNPLMLAYSFGATFPHLMKKMGFIDASWRALVGMLEQAPMARTAQEAGQILEGDKGLGETLVGHFIPQPIKDIAKMTDKEKDRKAKGFIQGVEKNLPILREQLQPKR